MANTGLEIKEKKKISIVGFLFWVALFTILGICGWFGYRYYTTGEAPPVLTSVAITNDEVDETPITPSAVVGHRVAPEHPRYLSIPSIDVSQARVLPIGLDPETGDLDVPKNIFDTGWYNESSTPGTGGAILIDAHNGGPTADGVFKNLPNLANGDEVTLERGDGELFTYVVIENKEVSLEDANKSEMKKMTQPVNPTKEGLNLITCTGKWIPKEKTYSHRQLLRAEIKE